MWPQGWRGDAPLAGFDAVAGLIALAAAVALLRWRVGVLPLLAACAAAGLVWRLLAGAAA